MRTKDYFPSLRLSTSLSRILEISSDFLFLLDENLRIVELNDAARLLFPPPPRPVGEAFGSWFALEGQEKGLFPLLSRLGLGEMARGIEGRLVFEEGDSRPCIISVIRLGLEGGAGPAYLLLVEDRPPEKTGPWTKALNLISAIPIEEITEPMLVINKVNRTIHDLNAEAGRFLGWLPEDLRGMSTMHIHEDSESYALFGRLYCREGARPYLWRLRRKDGELVSCSIFSLDGCMADSTMALVPLIFLNARVQYQSQTQWTQIARDAMTLSEKIAAITGGSAAVSAPAQAGLGLTRRQGQIVDLLARGLSSKEIAASLGLSEPTIKNHVSLLFRKYGVSSRLHLLNRLRELGVLVPWPQGPQP